MEIQTAPSR